MPALQINTAVVVQGGFCEPVFEAQAMFRALMDAMARPGTVHAIETSVSPPPPLSPVAGAVAATLCDHDTPVWLGPRMEEKEQVAAWLAFHTSAPITPHPMEARFAFFADPKQIVALDGFVQGTQDYPDRSTTIIVQCDSLTGGPKLELSGPGIRETAEIAPAGLPDIFPDLWAENHGRFPRGVDLILAGPDRIACLPRTTRIKATEDTEGAR
jgi:alpha-D-ribose 1-methylphosphonate 5-triphosphate synthase subunit PhnH